ncbi:hypothetical protein CHS0354_017790 [Potamilus streckersoni]|uniref:Uncharacterized protein n=1 Tax=Potamilus streckersoni TaxID=2493646 RepID=A0AAE0T9L6_9BIVA|nr:hypothetical protein CHS0354_017790 [Potamilus streckersoni]
MASTETVPEKCQCPFCPRCRLKLCTPNQSKRCHHTFNAHLKPQNVKPKEEEPVKKIGPLPIYSKELCASPKITAYGLSSDCDKLIAVPFENEERYGFFEDNPEIDLKKMRITSDLFHIKEGAFDFSEDIKITIELSKRERRKFEDFFIFARHRGKWSAVKTKYDIKTGILTFSIRCMDTFFAYSQQKVTKLNLTQNGGTFVSADDSTIKVDFPKDAVDEARNLSIRVLDIDKGLVETMTSFPNLFGITYMSPCVFVDHDMKNKLRRPATVQIPFSPENIPEDQELVLFHWEKSRVTIEPNKKMTTRFGKGLCTLEADEFSGQSVGVAKKCGVSDFSLDKQVRMSKGEIKLCKILTFRDPRDKLSLYIDCCQLIELDKRVSDLRSAGLVEIPLSRSKDLYLTEAERIKIQLKGSITYVAEVPKHYHCITYLSTCLDVHTTFPVKSAKKAAADPHGILVFETHGTGADTLHVVHYNPDRLDDAKIAFLPKAPGDNNEGRRTFRPGTETSDKNDKARDSNKVGKRPDPKIVVKKALKTEKKQNSGKENEEERDSGEDEDQKMSDED